MNSIKKGDDKKYEIIHDKENHGSYGKYLLDIRWREFRKKIIQRDNNKCTICNSESALQVHHKQYHFSETARTFKKPWEYSTNLLITICKKCHDFGHRKYKVPTKYIK
jgi:5-methylcytosine-specific restriction endonuclease McrA